MADENLPPELSVVVPVYREASGLSRLVSELHEALDAELESWELILVDDGSPDNTWDEIICLASADPHVRGIRLSRNFGKEAALSAGLRGAAGRAIVTMDGDLQHPPSVIPRMLSLWRSGIHVVDGVKRNRPDQGPAHRSLSSLFNLLFRRLTGVDLENATDFKLLDRKAADALSRLHERSHFYRGTAQWIGYSRTRLHFDVQHRPDGDSRWRISQLLRLATTAVTSFTAKPLHLVTFSGAAFLVFAIVLGTQTLIRFFNGSAVEGFTTVILLLLLLGGLILTGLGIIGAYLARIHDEVKGRPRYLIADETSE